jgi:hypothetical protein
MGETLDGPGRFCYTINNKRKRAEGRNNIKQDTYPAILYYYKNTKKRCGPRYKNPEPQVTNANESNLSPHKHKRGKDNP